MNPYARKAGCYCAMFVVSVLLVACSATDNTINSGYPIYPSAFSSVDTVLVESPEDIMALPDEAKAFVDSLKQQAINEDRLIIDALIDAVFSRRQLGVAYYNDANFTVTETFVHREANCLSLTLMAYAMAQEAGLSVRLQQVEIPEYWSRKQGFSVLNGHVNLVLTEHTPNGNEQRVVDFNENTVTQHFQTKSLPLNSALAMFYNNKAAIYLISQQYANAFQYFASALNVAPDFPQGWVNLGVLYRLNGYNNYAEQAYKRAISLDDEQLTAKENLAILYRMTNRTRQAKQLATEVHQARVKNPYYHLILGDEAFDEGKVRLASERYRRAYRLDRNNHLILFALGKAAFAQGKLTLAQGFLQRAYNRASENTDRNRYAAKLAMLRSPYGDE